MRYVRYFTTHSPITARKYLSLRFDDLKKISQQYNDKVYNIDTVQSVTSDDFAAKTAKTARDTTHNEFTGSQLKELNRQTLWFNLSKRSSQRKSTTNASANDKSYDLMIDGVPNYPIENELFSANREVTTLVQDVLKAKEFAKFQQTLESTSIPQGLLSDSFEIILKRAFSRYLSKISIPYLVNEDSEFEAPYAAKRATMDNLLKNACTRSNLDEATINYYLDNSIKSQKHISPLPPEVFEPLIAFRGITNWSHCPITRLDEKVTELIKLVNSVIQSKKTISNWDDESINQVLETLIENKLDSSRNHPFRNHYGFKSVVPRDVVGSIRAGKVTSASNERYPTLQSVAHSLPQDRKYRKMVVHAIRILERSRGWDHESKLKAISQMIQVCNDLAHYNTYKNILDKALPRERRKGDVMYTRNRFKVFRSGFKYIQSLTTNKPIGTRTKK